ncbi:minor capsid protein C from bacteriophage origin [Escherichia coli]|nr:minor capsid protein C from bacteriophage origin [Escherichia coli]
MTAELRNLPHIASMAFNEPLMLEPAYARGFFCALAGQLGISRLTDAVSGDSLTAQEALATLALSGDDDGPRQARSYQVMNGIAVLPVRHAGQPDAGAAAVLGDDRLQRHYRPSATGCQRSDGGRHSARYGHARRDGGGGI